VRAALTSLLCDLPESAWDLGSRAAALPPLLLDGSAPSSKGQLGLPFPGRSS